MNILIVASKFPPEYSGPGVRIPKLYKAISNDIDAGKISVLCGGIEYTVNENYNYEGLNVRRVVPSYVRARKFPFNLLPKAFFEAAVSFAENIAANAALKTYKDVDMLHVFGTSGITSAAIHWAGARNIPVFQELVTAKASPKQRYMLFGTTKPSDKCVIVTMQEEAKKRCRAAGFENQIWHRPNPFKEDLFHPVKPSEKQALRKSLTPFCDDDIILLTVAKLMPQKNQIFLIDVLRNLDERFKLVIAGPKVEQGPLYKRDMAYLNAIKQEIKDQNLESRVHLITAYVESHAYMKAADIYVLPAYDEGFGTPMMEAVACGLPVVANGDEPSFIEWLSEGQNGFLRPLNPTKWAEACGFAASIPMEKRLDEAKKIVNLAGQTHIYNAYIDKIRGLTS